MCLFESDGRRSQGKDINGLVQLEIQVVISHKVHSFSMQALLDAVARERTVMGLDERTLKDYLSDHNAPAAWVDYLKVMGRAPPKIVIHQPVKGMNGADKGYDIEPNLEFMAVRHLSRKMRKKGHMQKLFDRAKAEHHDFLLIAINPTADDAGHYWIDLRSDKLRVVEIMETFGVVERAGSLEEFLFSTEFSQLLK